VVVLGGVHEVPPGVVRESLVLRVDVEVLVERDVHCRRGVAPGGGLLGGDAELAGRVGQLDGQVGGAGEVPLGHQVGVDVVVLDGAVLVRAGHAVDPEMADGVVLAEGAPQAGGARPQPRAASTACTGGAGGC